MLRIIRSRCHDRRSWFRRSHRLYHGFCLMYSMILVCMSSVWVWRMLSFVDVGCLLLLGLKGQDETSFSSRCLWHTIDNVARLRLQRSTTLSQNKQCCFSQWERLSEWRVCACLVRLISSNDHVFLRSATRWLCCENVRMCVRVDTCVSMTLPALYISQLKMYVGMYCLWPFVLFVNLVAREDSHLNWWTPAYHTQHQNRMNS